MTITREDIAAFADGELSGERETEVAAAVTGDAELAQQVQRHRALKANTDAYPNACAETAQDTEEESTLVQLVANAQRHFELGGDRRLERAARLHLDMIVHG